MPFAVPAAAHADVRPELSFLRAEGVPLDVLTLAGWIARCSGTDGATALIRSGLMSEEAYYRALARALGAPYLAGAIALGPGARYPESILAGVAPLPPGGGPALVRAPRGAEIGHLLAGGARAGSGIAITAPGRLRAAVLEACARQAARQASEALQRAAPDWAYRPGPSPGQCLAACLALAAVPLLWDAPGSVQGAAAAAVSLLFLGMTVFRLAALLVPPCPLPDLPRAEDADLPVYTVLVALSREAAIVPDLIAALARLDYPATKLDAKIVIEADDAETAGALAARALPPWIEVIVAPPGEPRTKPRALNVALPLARGTYLAVYDAEDEPHPLQLRAAAALFARTSPRTACLQGRLVVDNAEQSWLTRCFALEYAALFDVLVPALAAWRLPIALGGTTTHFRTEALRAVHGWDAWNVTEDADLGLRLSAAGYRVGDLPLPTGEEMPSRPGRWLRQRTRWMKGFVQTTITHARRPVATARALGVLGTLAALALVPGAVVSALVYPAALLVAGWRLLVQPAEPDPSFWTNMVTALGIELFGAGFAAIALPALLGCLRRGRPDLIPWIAALPAYYVLVSLGAWLGLAEFFVAPFRWNKTEHGLARAARRRRRASTASELAGELRRGIRRRPHQVE
ncbi:glycosyltransferase family 2 protein [Methylobacterium sp. WSM2598]|uniref:glycosyltransferase family 2 protein n=1 Tax=Methylobacterium sp. WSM2598 TaxID=398261 RepID=UPI00037666EB|nr:glycosyltransferase family 2 protein [Methylobacterium sp. WSM2598]